VLRDVYLAARVRPVRRPWVVQHRMHDQHLKNWPTGAWNARTELARATVAGPLTRIDALRAGTTRRGIVTAYLPTVSDAAGAG